MCGIAGLVGNDLDTGNLHDNLVSLLSAIMHRGPDDSGMHVEPGLAVGMRRLSIIDINGGHQPMYADDENVVLVFNGEIYNFRELRRDLCSHGHQFSTNSDTEVVLRGYMQWGNKVFNYLNGMFAIAILDKRKRELILARDNFGIKPLYYISTVDSLVFCSEPAPLLDLNIIPRRINLESLSNYLSFKYVPSPNTFISGINKLRPGHYLRYSLDMGGIFEERYWDINYDPESLVAKDAEEILREKLKAAVRSQLVSDVPVGLFLSGGIDSGLLLWAATQIPGASIPDSYTIGFKENSYDESGLAEKTARHLKANHHIEYLSPPDAGDLDEWILSFGEPFANTSVPANMLISNAASRHLKVVLNGSGADEIFGGYDRYYAVKPPSILKLAKLLSPLMLSVMRHVPQSDNRTGVVNRVVRFLDGARLNPAEAHANSVRLFLQPEINHISPGLLMANDFIVEKFQNANGRDDLQKAIYTDIATMMADDYLTLIDRASMKFSLEVRVPFLDLDLARFGYSLASSLKINGWEKKSILRRLSRDVLPRSVSRHPKRGFDVPVGRWFRNELKDKFRDVCESSPLSSLFNLKNVSLMHDAHIAGRVDASKKLLAIYTLNRWASLMRVTL